MLIEDDSAYILTHRHFYETIDNYVVEDSTWIDQVRRILPATSQMLRHSIWMHCIPQNVVIPAQGWKIHVSATPANAAPILTSVSRLLGARTVAFKFVVDRTMFLMQSSKQWSRGGAGKFITIFPNDEAECGELLETLRQLLTGYRGPLILSDRRYRDSSVVHYRYGGMLPVNRLDVTGRKIPVITAGDGSYLDDERKPFFNLPPNITDPFFIEKDGPAGDDLTLKNGRYRIESAITFSVSGGVYIGRDTETDTRVLIKEARPLASMSPRGTDAVWLLKKEERLLQLVADLEIAPRPLDFFQDWEHFYLVEAFLEEGVVLRGYMNQEAMVLRTRPTLETVQRFFERYRKVMKRVAEMLEMLHERNIVFSDISHYNVWCRKDGTDFRMIDFEGAYERGVDIPTLLFTRGFAPHDMIDQGQADFADDCFGIGGLLLASVFPINALLGLDPTAATRIARTIADDFGFPREVAGLMDALLSPNAADRPTPRQVVEVLDQARVSESPAIQIATDDKRELEQVLEGMVSYILDTADFTREDRLFPGDPAVFETNPLSVAHGACGVAYALQRLTGSVPQPILEWIEQREIDPHFYPPGLYYGLSGIAWTFLELGFTERAEECLRMAREHHLLRRVPDLVYGVAGWGLAELRFWLATADPSHLAAAETAARILLETKDERDGVWMWKSQPGICCGLGHGSAGIALFFTYLHLATNREEFLTCARRALSHVAARPVTNMDGGASWYAIEGQPTYTPYWRWGSAGVGVALLRYLAVDDDPELTELLDRLVIDCDRKYAIFAGRFFGLSGIGDFFVDAEQIRNEPAYRTNAMRVLAGVKLFQLERPNGIAYPGDTLSRISCDFATGSAGVALFFDRLVRNTKPAFMLDELLPSLVSAESCAEADAVLP